MSKKSIKDDKFYGYYGDDSVERAVYKYIAEELPKEFKPPLYAPTKIHIPFVKYISIDHKDDEDLVYIDSWLENHNIVGDILECTNTGGYSGVMHVKNNKVVKFDQLINLNYSGAKAKKILGDHYDEFMKVQDEEGTLENFRRETIRKYVESNGLKVTKFQDEGWDPEEIYE